VLSLPAFWLRNGGVAEKKEMYVRFNNKENAEEENNGYFVIIKIISTDQLEKRWPFLQQASGQIFYDDVDCFSSASDICFMVFSRRIKPCYMFAEAIILVNRRTRVYNNNNIECGGWWI
jgi:hypothetical protein